MFKVCFVLAITASIILYVPFATVEKIGQCFLSKFLNTGNDNLTYEEIIKSIWTGKKDTCVDQNEEEELDTINVLNETGLEFLRDDIQLSFEENFYFNKEDGSVSENLSPVEVAQAFIHDIRGFSRGWPVEGEIGSGPRDVRRKQDWVYYPYSLKSLVELEIGLYYLLKLHYENKPELHPHPALESYLLDFEESTLKALNKAEELAETPKKHKSILNEDVHLYIASHPILIYRMIRRFSRDLQPILFSLMQDEPLPLLNQLSVINKDSEVFPDGEDLEETWKSLRRIQLAINLKTTDFAIGKLENVETGFGLNALHALELGMFYIEEHNYDLALQWIHLARVTIMKHPAVKKYPIIQRILDTCLNYAIEKHNAGWGHLHKHQWNPGVFSTRVKAPFDPKSYVRVEDLLAIKAAEERNKTHWNFAVKKNFYQTCAGINLQSEQAKAALKCYYDRKRHPYWYINPLKMELLHKDPPLYQIHEFIGDELIEKIKAATKSSLIRSTVVDKNHATRSVVDSTRTSTQTWVYDAQHSGKFMAPLTRKMEFLSGLTIVPVQAQDAFQVALYGPSHHYEAHIDSFEDPRRTVLKGNRITTLMGYLSDVEVGGRTGFPVMGTFADPEKGSVVMWNNMMRNMNGRDLRTWHGGCPVVLGTKWITNKWVYSGMNVFNFKCSLNEND